MNDGRSRRLIVNADDFGQSHGVNRGVITAHERGIVTSASLMVRWPAADDAGAYARAHPGLSAGLHLDLGEWARRDGRWLALYEVVPLDDHDAVAAEAHRQLERFGRLIGHDPTHLDSHQHVHRDEPVRSVLKEMARQLGVPLRECDDQVHYCGAFYGQTGNGEPVPDAIGTEGLIKTLVALPVGVTELGCHPGHGNDVDSMYGPERALEVEVLCDPSVQATLVTERIELSSFASLPPVRVVDRPATASSGSRHQDASRFARSEYPDLRTLTDGLTAMLSAGESRPGPVTVLDRVASDYSSSFPSEVVTCRVNEADDVRLFCKYSRRTPDPASHLAHGHRKGVAYEAQVYCEVLEPLGLSTARLFGVHRSASGETWLILQQLDRAAVLPKTPDAAAMVFAARWIGRFGALSGSGLDGSANGLQTYDEDYYRGWGRRMVESGEPATRGAHWLGTLRDRFDESVRTLLAAPSTVIHGEYYPANILVQDGTIYPVDWETAAVAPGEIDLAFLTDLWPTELVEQAEQAYRVARWPDGAPSGFEDTLRAARFYLLLRWAGEQRAWSKPARRTFHLRQLRAQAERLGVL